MRSFSFDLHATLFPTFFLYTTTIAAAVAVLSGSMISHRRWASFYASVRIQLNNRIILYLGCFALLLLLDWKGQRFAYQKVNIFLCLRGERDRELCFFFVCFTESLLLLLFIFSVLPFRRQYNRLEYLFCIWISCGSRRERSQVKGYGNL